MLLMKAKHSLTQSACEDIMLFKYKSYPVPEEEQPLTFYQFLTFLEDQGNIIDCHFVEYEYCKKCGTLYSGSTHKSPICLNGECGEMRLGNTSKFMYR